eukprot:6933130-Prymnesium_polylepis.1
MHSVVAVAPPLLRVGAVARPQHERRRGAVVAVARKVGVNAVALPAERVGVDGEHVRLGEESELHSAHLRRVAAHQHRRLEHGPQRHVRARLGGREAGAAPRDVGRLVARLEHVEVVPAAGAS